MWCGLAACDGTLERKVCGVKIFVSHLPWQGVYPHGTDSTEPGLKGLFRVSYLLPCVGESISAFDHTLSGKGYDWAQSIDPHGRFIYYHCRIMAC